MIEFFMAMEPPTATAQMHQVQCRNGRPIFYDPPRVRAMKAKLYAALLPHRPDAPMDGPLRLTTKWIWHNKARNENRYKPTKPDTDNLVKALKDLMETAGYFRDDAQVCSEIIEKFYGRPAGIYIKLEAIET